jgi:hypothetical protein
VPDYNPNIAVGSFPNMREIHRRAVRGPVNPLDRSTIVSIYPRPIRFKNVTLSPGRWYIEAGSVEKPALLEIGPSSWFKDVGLDEPLLEISQSSVMIADSLVKDYLNGMFACNMHDSVPGLLFIPGGDISRADLRDKDKYKNLMARTLDKQMNYYRNLVKYADALWARSNGNPLALNDEMRMAARALGVQDKDWMKDHSRVDLAPCFACGEFKNPEYPICKSCHTVDPNHPKAKLVVKADPFASLNKPEGK